jgi:hypothetical protein
MKAVDLELAVFTPFDFVETIQLTHKVESIGTSPGCSAAKRDASIM